MHIPKVGVAVSLRALGHGKEPYFAMIRRATPPAAGSWSLPGGRLEWGETLTGCAQRELTEETGLEPAAVAGAFFATDAIYLAEGHHYVVVHVLATAHSGPAGELPALRAADDACDACWVQLDVEGGSLSPLMTAAMGTRVVTLSALAHRATVVPHTREVLCRAEAEAIRRGDPLMHADALLSAPVPLGMA
jgi:ADP-ribose pyrophosphatase YjhB (NUDIX family)